MKAESRKQKAEIGNEARRETMAWVMEQRETAERIARTTTDQLMRRTMAARAESFDAIIASLASGFQLSTFRFLLSPFSRPAHGRAHTSAGLETERTSTLKPGRASGNSARPAFRHYED